MATQHRHTGAARHARKRRLWPRVVAWTAGGLAVVMIGGAGALALKLQGNIQTAPLSSGTTSQPSKAPSEPHDAMNIVLIGSDSRDLEGQAYGEADGSRRSDSLVLVHLAKDDKRIDVVQIPRDTLINAPACEDTGSGASAGGYSMINAALMHGESCSVSAVQELTGVPIDHFISLDFDGFSNVVDAIGGLPVCLPDAMRDPLAELDLPAGEQDLDGRQALALARTRHAVGDGSDIARLGNQQKVMSALVQQVTSAEVITRPDRLVNFLDAVTSSLTVDTGLGSLSALSGLAQRVAAVPSDQITFMSMPWAEAPTDRNRVVPSPEAAIVFSNIAADAPINLASEDTPGGEVKDNPDETTASTPTRTVPVTVLNGTMTGGLATSTSNKAREAGYTIAGIGDATATPTTSLLIPDTADARATATSLAAELGYTLEPTVDPSVAGVTLVIGDDLESISKPVVSEKPVDTTARTADTQLCG